MKKKRSIHEGGKKTNRKRDLVRRACQTAKLRKSYAQSAERSLQICKEWEPLDDEAWAMLDKMEAQKYDF